MPVPGDVRSPRDYVLNGLQSLRTGLGFSASSSRGSQWNRRLTVSLFGAGAGVGWGSVSAAASGPGRPVPAEQEIQLANGSDPRRPVFASAKFRWISERRAALRREALSLFSVVGRTGVRVMAKKRKQVAAKRIGKRKSVSKKAQPGRKAAVALVKTLARRVAKKRCRGSSCFETLAGESPLAPIAGPPTIQTRLAESSHGSMARWAGELRHVRCA
jgi:hypothetical protein